MKGNIGRAISGVNKVENVPEFFTIVVSGRTLTNNEMKDIIKVIRSLENRGILLKETTKRISSQEGGFLNFLIPLMTAGLPLMKNVLIPLAISILVPLGLTTATSATDATLQKKIFWSGTALLFLNEEMDGIMKSLSRTLVC